MTTEKRCDRDSWTDTKTRKRWLIEHNATELLTRWGFTFWEHPLRGDEAPVLATRANAGDGARVYNTQDFDLPVSDPKEAWQ